MTAIKRTHNREINILRAMLIVLVILVHIANFGQLYPEVKARVLAFLMPAFLLITGYLTNVDKRLLDFGRYVGQIALPYVILVTGFALLSLYFPVRDGLEVFSWEALVRIVLIDAIGPYWFLHTMLVCSTLYYVVYWLFAPLGLVGRYTLLGVTLALVARFTPLLGIESACYYYMGIGVHCFWKDFSRLYVHSLWPLLPFGLLMIDGTLLGADSIGVLISVVCFFSFATQIGAWFKGRVAKVVDYVGRNTFPIYIFHPIFTLAAKYLLPLFAHDTTGLMHTFTTIIMSLVGCLAMAALLDRTRLCYLFGRAALLR